MGIIFTEIDTQLQKKGEQAQPGIHCSVTKENDPLDMSFGETFNFKVVQARSILSQTFNQNWGLCKVESFEMQRKK